MTDLLLELLQFNDILFFFCWSENQTFENFILGFW